MTLLSWQTSDVELDLLTWVCQQNVKISCIHSGMAKQWLKIRIRTSYWISNVNRLPRKRSRDQWRITTHHLVVINICQHCTAEEMDSFRLSSRLCQYVNLKENIQPAGSAWPKKTRGIRPLKINGGWIWTMSVSLDKSCLFFSQTDECGSHLVWPPPSNSFPE